LRQPARHAAKKSLTVVDDFIRGEWLRGVGSRRCRERNGPGRRHGQKLAAGDIPHGDILRGGQDPGAAQRFRLTRFPRRRIRPDGWSIIAQQG
jgi:hypothetical protein